MVNDERWMMNDERWMIMDKCSWMNDHGWLVLIALKVPLWAQQTFQLVSTESWNSITGPAWTYSSTSLGYLHVWAPNLSNSKSWYHCHATALTAPDGYPLFSCRCLLEWWMVDVLKYSGPKQDLTRTDQDGQWSIILKLSARSVDKSTKTLKVREKRPTKAPSRYKIYPHMNSDPEFRVPDFGHAKVPPCARKKNIVTRA